MYKTFYIDVDEEITSVVERLRSARSKEVAVVIPKRALLIQSIVNLRLLKKEADNLGISILAVTQDKLGRLLVEKAGICLGKKFDELEGQRDFHGETEIDLNNVELSKTEEAFSAEGGNDWLSKVGSENYFEEKKSTPERLQNPDFSERKKSSLGKNSSENGIERLTNRELVTDISSEGSGSSASKLRPAVDSMSREKTGKIFLEKKSPDGESPVSDPVRFFQSQEEVLLPKKSEKDFFDKRVEKFFGQQEAAGGKMENESQKKDNTPGNLPEKSPKGKLSGAVKWTAGVFGGIALLSAAFLAVPKADILIETEVKMKSGEFQLQGSADLKEIDYDKKIIPLEEADFSEEISKKFPVSGSEKVSNQKAKGEITIYNEFSSAPQSLVATTRFETPEGKIFRLVKGVVVPGLKEEGGSSVPGSVDVEVVADQGGEEFNVGPSKFTIPGFKEGSSAKYDKIYAKSSSSMTGGGKGTDSAKSISQSDIEKAKKEMSADMDRLVEEKISEKIAPGMKILPCLIKKEEPVYKISNSPGEVVSNFEIKVQFQSKGLVFSEENVRQVAQNVFSQSGSKNEEVFGDSIILEYGGCRADFDKKSAEIEVVSKGRTASGISEEEIRKGVLGKNNAELEKYLSGFSGMKKAEIIYWPPFFSRWIPLWEKRVNVKIQ